jgi:tetratricopeptide (TPR) repeat protein
MPLFRKSPEKLIVGGMKRLKDGKYKLALKDFLKASEKEPTNSKSWNLIAQTYLKLKEFENAIDAIDKAIALDQSNSLYWQIRGTILMQNGRHKVAITSIENAIKLKPSDVSYMLRGQCSYQLNELEEALFFFKKVLEIDPEHPLGNQMIGLTYFKMSEFEKAISPLEKALSYGESESLRKILEETRRKISIKKN